MKKIKNIAVVTGSRAEYGVLKPLLKIIQHSKDLEPRLYVTGTHLLKRYGHTVDTIKRDGFIINAEIPMYNTKDDAGKSIGIGLSKGIKNFTEVFSRHRPDIVLVFGDRLEPLAATLAAAILNIPIGHIHGGDKTDSGHIDESTRHAITKYSHIHFAPTRAAARRLLQMGEQDFRVYNVGTLSVDSVLEIPKLTKHAVCKILDIDRHREIIVCLFNPLPLESEAMGVQIREICAALRALKKQTIIIYPNNDKGSQDIIRGIESMRDLEYVTIFKNLPPEQYINLLRVADVLIGNSSSGIIEAPVLRLPVVNIGSRNVGREHAANVIFTEPERSRVQRAVKKALNKSFRAKIRTCKSPYGYGGAAGAIVSILKKIELNQQLMLKKITY